MITEEDKELLLKDLCARQPYSVMINTSLFEKPTLLKGIADNMCWAVVDEDNYEWVDIDDVKPYLRPLSSMTEEERLDLAQIGIYIDKGDIMFDAYDYRDISLLYVITPYIDWLNQHHFDYRDLIRKGLALEAPENMYNN